MTQTAKLTASDGDLLTESLDRGNTRWWPERASATVGVTLPGGSPTCSLSPASVGPA